MEHFDLASHDLAKAFLVDVSTNQPILSDQELLPSPNKFYFLALSHA